MRGIFGDASYQGGALACRALAGRQPAFMLSGLTSGLRSAEF